MVSKIAYINSQQEVCLNSLSRMLDTMCIKEMNIIIIDNNSLEGIVYANTINCNNESAKVTILEMKPKYFVEFLNNPSYNFSDYNHKSLYIIRHGNFTLIRALFSWINGRKIYFHRSSQKSHILSPIDLRLSSYLLAMFNVNYALVSKINKFNYLRKNMYLLEK